MIDVFTYGKMSDFAAPKAGLATGDNDRFIRLWHEVGQSNIGFNYTDTAETINSSTKWFPCLSGGRSRKWGCHEEYVVDWQNDGYNLKHFVGSNGRLASRPQNTQFYFKEGLTWNKISSNACHMWLCCSSWTTSMLPHRCLNPVVAVELLAVVGDVKRTRMTVTGQDAAQGRQAASASR